MYSAPLDPAMPHLQALFPAAGAPTFVAQMAQDVAGTPVNPEGGEVSYVRYRPTRNCAVLWSFPGPSGTPLLVSGLSGDEVGDHTTRRSFQQSAEMVRAATGGKVCPYKYMPDQRLLLQVYPLDMRLPGLALAASQKWINLPFQQFTGLPSHGALVTKIAPVSYKPWRRCVLHYVVEVQGRPVQYFGKVFRDHRGEPMVARLQALKAQLVASGAAWDIATPVTYVPEARMLVLAAMEKSEELSALLKEAVRDHQARQVLREQITRVAEGLLSFQRMVVPGLDCVGPADVLKELEDELDGLVQVTPALAQHIEVGLRKLEMAASRLPSEEMLLSHGALRYNQFLRRRDRLIALDLDALCLSGAGADAGEFLAYLDLTALRRRNLRSVVPDCQEFFLDSLLKHRRMDPRWIAWYRTAAHMKWALRTFFSLDPRWPNLTDGLLQLADQVLGGGQPHV